MTLAVSKPSAIAQNEGIEQVEAHMLNQDQADCPVAHHFGPGVYIREVFLPAGIVAVGHKHKQKHMNMMVKGKMALLVDDRVEVVEAPFMMVSDAGRKVAYVIEDAVWQNIYATDETDIDKLEDMFLEKSDTFKAFESANSKFQHALHEPMREDYGRFLEEYGLAEDVVRSISEDESDMEGTDNTAFMVRVCDSPIEGKGLFSQNAYNEGAIICPARILGRRTIAGRYCNHSPTPNCKFDIGDDGNIYLIALRDISGCKGGDHGEELTVNYRDALALNLEVS